MITLPRSAGRWPVVTHDLVVCLWCRRQTETATVRAVTDRTLPRCLERKCDSKCGAWTVTTTITNNTGIYVFPSVQLGKYQISIQKQGFKQVDLLGLIVNVRITSSRTSS